MHKSVLILLTLLGFGLASTDVVASQERHQEFPTYFTHANGISIAYQDFGNPEDETVLLVMGLGGQLIHWSDDFVNGLVDGGYRVIRYDNRDAGLSERFIDEPTPGLMTLLRYKLGWDLNAPYSLDDMAADGMALLDQLGIERAHVAGVSMGGMISQLMAADYPDRVLSLTSIMSTSGAAHLPQSTLDIQRGDRSDMTRAEIIEQSITMGQIIDGPAEELSENEWRKLMSRTYDRAHYDDGFGRQMWAIVGSGDRVEKLKTVTARTLVIHGKDDPLIPYQGGEHTAELVAGSKLVLIEGMGHFIAPQNSSQIVNEMIHHMDATISKRAR